MAGLLAGLALAAIANAAAVPNNAAVPSGALVLPLVREVTYAAYFTRFGLGTPVQYEYVELDTGSPFIAFENPKNNICSEKSQPCKRYGTFTNTSSSTSRYISGLFDDDIIDFGEGDVLSDTLHIGNTAVKNFTFGYIDGYSFPDQVAVPTHTICGLGLNCNKFSKACYNTGTSLLVQLYNKSVISRHAVSVYFGPEETNVTNAQIIVGNAYDKAKQASTPFTVPMIPGQGTTNWVNTTAVSVTINGTTTRLALTPQNVTLLDTGNPFIAIPAPLWKPIAKVLGLPLSPSASAPYQGNVSCSGRNLPSKDVFTVEFGSAAKNISVPLAQMVTDFGNGKCGSFLYNGGPSSSGLAALGDPFLRGVYLTLDQDSFTATMAQVKYTTATDLVPLVSKS